MKKVIKTLVFLMVIFTFISCKKAEVPKNTPECIKNEIEKIKSQNVSNPAGSVWRYEYNGQTVYYIPASCCDIPSMLFDEKCNFIGSPDGGITGAGDGKCPDFFSKRKNEKLIWKDKR